MDTTPETQLPFSGAKPMQSHARFEKTLLINQNIIIIHSTPLMRLGITAALYDSSLFSRFSISSFRTLEEADTKIIGARFGDVVVLDVDAWTSLTLPARSDVYQNIRMRGLVFGLIAMESRTDGSILELEGLSGLIGPEAEIGRVVSMVQDLVDGRRHFFQKRAPVTSTSRLSSLSKRQVEILKLMTQGLLNKQIASELGITEGTVKSHVSTILEKLNCARRTQAIATYIKSAQESSSPI